MDRRARTSRRPHSPAKTLFAGFVAAVLGIWGAALEPARAQTTSAAPSTSSVPSSSLVSSSVPDSSVPTLGTTTCIDERTVASWPLIKQAGQVLMFGMPITRAKFGRDLIRRYDLAGVLVRGNPRATDATAIQSLRDAKIGAPTIVAVDEEGGRVQHLRSAVGTLPSARLQAKLDPIKLRALIAKHARGMRQLGFTMNFGPVVDLTPSTPMNNGIGDRSYGSDPTRVSIAAGAFVDGMLDGGIYPVLKHFPGHGNASGDTHNVGAKTPPWSTLQAADALPFRTLTAGRPGRVGIMTAHLHVPGLDDRPISLSKPAITGVLRDQWRFDGLTVTDSLSMWSVSTKFSAPDAAVEALKAGNDLLLYDNDPDLGAIISRLANAAATDKDIAARLIQADLRVLRAAGANVCAGSLLGPVPTSSAPASTTTSTTAP